MCLAVPAKVTAIDRNAESATVSIGGVLKDVSIALLDAVDVDDYVLVHVGYALNRISADEARITLELMAQAGLPAGEEAVA